MDNGKELIEEPAVKAQIRRQAQRVNLKSFALACILTALGLAIPRF